MPRAEVGTPKYIANAMKSKGLQRLRWYCQVCQKQCRDENGFKCHTQSESHLRQMLVVGESAGKHIADFSAQFSSAFVALLSRSFGTNRVKANTVYQQYIQDKNHLHMNATRWVTLSAFVQYLGRAGICHIDETEKGWFIAWIDSSPKALAKAEASMKKERMKISDEQRERNMLADQIEHAAAMEAENAANAADAAEEGSTSPPTRELERSEEKVVLGFSLKAPAPAPEAAQAGPSTSIKLAANPLKVNPLKAKPAAAATNPLKRPNVFKTATAGSSSAGAAEASDASAGKKREREMSAAERLIHEDQERKRRRMERESGSVRAF